MRGHLQTGLLPSHTVDIINMDNFKLMVEMPILEDSGELLVKLATRLSLAMIQEQVSSDISVQYSSDTKRIGVMAGGIKVGVIWTHDNRVIKFGVLCPFKYATGIWACAALFLDCANVKYN